MKRENDFIGIKIDSNLKEQLMEIAEQNQLYLSELIRQILKDYLKEFKHNER